MYPHIYVMCINVWHIITKHYFGIWVENLHTIYVFRNACLLLSCLINNSTFTYVRVET